MNFFRSTVTATLLSATMISPASAVSVFVEGSDAGASTGSAADATGLLLPAVIYGSLSLEPSGLDFVDMFEISLGSNTSLSVSTGSGSDPSLIADPVLFLFSSAGIGVAMNDECCGNGQSGFGISLLAGNYYLAIAFSGVQPLDGNGNAIFDAFGSLAVLSSDPLASWEEAPFALDPSAVGAYQISLVPEPGTLGLMLLSLLGLGGTVSRRRATA